MNTTLLSYPNRGPWGRSDWRGNWSGHLVKDLVQRFKPSLVVDPMCGSNTTGDVCREMGVEAVCLDLKDGFNILREPIRNRLSRPANLVLAHSPYGAMISYSGPGGMWGQDRPAHPDDLSNVRSPEEFMEKLELALHNCYDALAVGGHLAVCISDHRFKGELYCYFADIVGLRIGRLRHVLIKEQCNATSLAKKYSGDIVYIAHEYVGVFERVHALFSIGQCALERSRRLSRSFYGTWKNVVRHILQSAGKPLPRVEIYRQVNAAIDAPENRHVEAKLRQILNESFRRVDNDVFGLPDEHPAAA